MVIADQVSGSALGLTLALQESPDITYVHSRHLKYLVNAVPVAGQVNIYQGSLSDADGPICYSYNIFYALTGTAPAVHLRIWVTGRGRV